MLNNKKLLQGPFTLRDVDIDHSYPQARLNQKVSFEMNLSFEENS